MNESPDTNTPMNMNVPDKAKRLTPPDAEKTKVSKDPNIDSDLKKLKELKEWVEAWRETFSDNEARHLQLKNFIFNTNLTQSDITKLNNLKKPVIEFNILAANAFTVLDEFRNHEPDVNVHSCSGDPQALSDETVKQIEVIEAYMREVLYKGNNDDEQATLFLDTLCGYTIAEVYVDYRNNLSFDKDIFVSKVHDITQAGFDPLARLSHKGDGRYCFQYTPITKKDFELEYGKALTEKMNFVRNPGVAFHWSFSQKGQEVIIVCDLYERKSVKGKIVKLANDRVIAKKHYAAFLEQWNSQDFLEAPPEIVDERVAVFDEIVKYRFCETGIIETTETDLDYLPYVYIDGFSVEVADAMSSDIRQVIIPYGFHALGAQRMINFAGQTQAAYIENLVMHKFKVQRESLPTDDASAMQAYRDVQHADVLIYKGFLDGNPQYPLNAPQEVQQPDIPGVVENTFYSTEKIMQSILGTYDQTALTDNSRDVSGKGMQEALMLTNKASSTYLKGYLRGMQRVLEIVLSLIPKYFVTERTIPVRLKNGTKSYIKVNPKQGGAAGGEEGVHLQYNKNDLGVTVEMGANSSVQKRLTQEQVIRMMSTSETFSSFVNQECLGSLVDMMDLPNEEAWKAGAQKYMEQLRKQQEAQQQEAAAQAQNNPQAQMQEQMQLMAQIEQSKIAMEAQNNEMKNAQRMMELTIKEAQVSIEKQKADIDAILAASEIANMHGAGELEREKLDSANAKHAVEHMFEVNKHILETQEATAAREQEAAMQAQNNPQAQQQGVE